MIPHPDVRMPSFRDDAEIADPGRIRREVARWEGLGDATKLARITVLHHGGHRRPIIHRGSGHLRSRIVSRKTNRLQITEGKGLRMQVLRCETGAVYLDYEAHPFKVEAVDRGVPLIWYPDIVWVERGKLPTICEIKRTVEDLGDPEYASKLAIMAEVFRRVGWTFRVLYEEEIFGDETVRRDRAANVADVHSRRFIRVSPAEARALADIVSAGEELSWGDACASVAPADRLRGDAVVAFAAGRGMFAFDFDRPVTKRTRLTPLAPPRPNATFRV